MQNIQDSPFYPKYNLSSLMQSALMPNILETVEEVNGGGEPGVAYSRPVKYQATSSSSCGAKKTRKNFSSFSLSVYYAYVKKNKPSQLKVRISSVFLLVTTARTVYSRRSGHKDLFACYRQSPGVLPQDCASYS